MSDIETDDDKAASWYGDTTPTAEDIAHEASGAIDEKPERPPSFEDDPDTMATYEAAREAAQAAQGEQDADDAGGLEVRYDDSYESQYGVELDTEAAEAFIDVAPSLGIDQTTADDIMTATARHMAQFSVLENEQQARQYFGDRSREIAARFSDVQLARAEAWINEKLPQALIDRINQTGLGSNVDFVAHAVRLSSRSR